MLHGTDDNDNGNDNGNDNDNDNGGMDNGPILPSDLS